MAQVARNSAVVRAVEDLRKRLLDLSRANRLLNFKHTKRSTLSIVSGDLNLVFEGLSEGRRVAFKAVPEPGAKEIRELGQKPTPEAYARKMGLPTDAELSVSTTSQSATSGKGPLELQTLHYQDQLESVLTSIRRAATTAEQETGSNLLHLVFGFLDWRAPADLESPNLAPLIMMPVRLEQQLVRGEAKYEFFLRYSGEDLETNVSLQEMLKASFQLALPEVDSEDQDLPKYLAAARTLGRHKPEWKVVNRLSLGLLNFRKLIMYRDLSPEKRWGKWGTIHSHPLVKTILGYGDASEPLGSNIPRSTKSPENRLQIEPPLVLDADSSQQAAIADALSGRNMVIDGPPGTGKSQTIANLVAAAMQAGKTVLFVAEKRAALEVVHQRLQKIGLSSFCLELHSDRANRRVFLSDLANRLALESPRDKSRDITSCRKRSLDAHNTLSRYGRLVSQKWEPLGVTIFALIWTRHQLAESLRANLKALEEIRLKNTDKTSNDTLQTRSETMSDFAQQVAKLRSEFTSVEKHPWHGISSTALHDPARRAELIRSLREVVVCAKNVHELLQGVSKRGVPLVPRTISEARTLVQGTRRLPHPQREYAFDLLRPMLERPVESKLAIRLLEAAVELNQQRKRIVGLYDLRRAPSPEVLRVAARIVTDTGFFGRLFSGNYRGAVKLHRAMERIRLGKSRADVAGSMVDIATYKEKISRLGLEDSYEETRSPDFVLALVKHDRKTFEAGIQSLQTLFGRHLNGVDSDLDALKAAHDLAISILKSGLPSTLQQWVADGDYPIRRTTLQGAADDLSEPLSSLEEKWTHSATLGGMTPRNWGGADITNEQTVTDLAERSQRALDRQTDLPQWVDYLAARIEAAKVIQQIVILADRSELPTDKIEIAYRYIFFNTLLEEIHQVYPSLGTVNTLGLEKSQERFAEADRELMALQRSQIAHALMTRHVPDGISRGRVGDFTEMGLLRNELQKQKRHLAIRRLMERSLKAIQALKPCFMMSPVSVAQFLDPAKCQFDLVIMDEASQMLPEEALGAIARAEQVVIAGDPKQLPPTSFFQRHIGVDDADPIEIEDATQAQEAESILEAASKIWNGRRLLWHYRSRHQSLIAFSNERFYDRELVITPSPFPASPSLGVRFVPVVGGQFKDNRNLVEVARVAQLVGEHVRNNPKRSLGIVTMNFYQQEAIENAIDNLRKKDSMLQEFEELHAGEEPLFIKNLENAQGDERDTIIISTTYGPGPDGKVTKRFGPINQENGWRRLNVLFTRAKENVVVVSSLTPELIGDTSQSRGVEVFRDYLTYASTGQLGGAQRTRNRRDDSHAASLSRQLEQHGFDVETQIGVGEYRLDLGVRQTNGSGRFVVGVEFDGPAYASFESTRDRDRLRPEVLKGMDWDIHRIWSAQWYREPQQELDRLLSKIGKRLAEDASSGTGESAAPDREEVAFRLEPPASKPLAEDLEHRRTGESEKARREARPRPGGSRLSSPQSELPIAELSPAANDGPLAGPKADEVHSGTRDGLLSALIRLRDDEVLPNCPTENGKLCVLDPLVIEVLSRHLPITLDEWFRNVPKELRQRLDGHQFRSYRDDIFDLIAEHH